MIVVGGGTMIAHDVAIRAMRSDIVIIYHDATDDFGDFADNFCLPEEPLAPVTYPVPDVERMPVLIVGRAASQPINRPRQDDYGDAGRLGAAHILDQILIEVSTSVRLARRVRYQAVRTLI